MRVFADNALLLRRAGFAVLPSSGKEPLVSGFNRWRSGPTESTVGKWAGANPGADIAFIPGLSGPKGHKRGWW